MALDIVKTYDGSTLTVTLVGRLDTSTAPQLDAELRELLEDVDRLMIDFKDLVYVSSAGLRVLLNAQKFMSTRSGMAVRNVRADVMDVFRMTGFVDFLEIQ